MGLTGSALAVETSAGVDYRRSLPDCLLSSHRPTRTADSELPPDQDQSTHLERVDVCSMHTQLLHTSHDRLDSRSS